MLKLIRDSWLIFGSALRITLRNPAWVVIGLFTPICYMLLFAPLLKNLVGMPGFPTGGAYNTFTPGLMLMMAMYGSAFAGMALITRLREGVVERWRVTPVSRLALMLGMVAVDLLNLLIQDALLLGLGLLLGFRPNAGGVLLLLALLLLGGLMMASCSYAVALVLKNESSLSAMVNLFALPLLLLSGILLPLSLAPDILQNIARANPFAYAVTAGRALVGGQLSDTTVMQAFIIFGIAALLALFWATRSLHKATM
ncbi:MAG TPA: ABC transporter permease [Ktedonobacteraceae bacterium]|nr:ABC transporter permease [Ktedonobacteraceae bacterium]